MTQCRSQEKVVRRFSSSQICSGHPSVEIRKKVIINDLIFCLPNADLRNSNHIGLDLNMADLKGAHIDDYYDIEYLKTLH